MKIEMRSIDYIPSEERHGKARDLFTVWFAANMHITTLVAGALTVSLGLNLFWSIVAIIIGNLLGALFMASHSAQGPQLGIPQMIQSRAQFGVIGAIFPLFLVMFIYFGYFASSGLLGAQTLSSALSIDLTWSILIMNAACFIIALYGYDLIHKMQRHFSWLFFIIFLIATYLIVRLPVPTGNWSPGNFDLSAFLLAVSITATWQLSYAPYVADYSRYLPTNTPTSQTFWYSYSGTVIGSCWMMILGAFLTVSIPNYLDHSGSNLAALFGRFSIIMYIVIVLGQLSINVFNLYGAFMSTITTLEPFCKLRVTPRIRAISLFCITAFGTALCIWGQGDFLSFFMNFIFLIGYFLIPWTSINLVDYYLLRRGQYSVKDIFNVNGCYGKVNWITITAFVVAIIAEIPFINTTMYVGAFAKAFDGADIAWAVGLIVPALLYYFPMKRRLNNSTNTIETNTYAGLSSAED